MRFSGLSWLLLASAATGGLARPLQKRQILSADDSVQTEQVGITSVETPVANEQQVTFTTTATPAVTATPSPGATVVIASAPGAVTILSTLVTGGVEVVSTIVPAQTVAPQATGTTVVGAPQQTSMPGTIPGPTVQQAPQAGDLFVLNYALTLEHLESAFYREVATRFSAEDFRVAGFDPNIRTQMQLIGAHEDTHVQVLSQVIEATFGAGSAVPPCEYNFPLDSVATVVAVASALERTGVSAYDGAVKFIVDDAIKTAGASIATVEGRHAAILNAINTQKVQVNNQIVTANINPAPAPFDTPLGFTPVFSIAAPFIRQCPFALPVQPFPSLSLSRPFGNLGDTIGLLFTAALAPEQITAPAALHCNFAFGLTQKRTPITISQDPRTGGLTADCQVPLEAQGFQEVVMFVVNQDQDVSLDNDRHVVAGPNTFQVLEQTIVKVATA